MYSVSAEYLEKIKSDNRYFTVKLTFDSSTELTGTTIQNVTLDEIINSGEALTMGCACSNKITVNLINPPSEIPYEGSSFTAEVGLLMNDRPITYEWIPLGKFYGATAETTNDFKNLTLTAYDGFYKMTGKYYSAVSSTTTLQALYTDLRSQLIANCGIKLKTISIPEYTISNFPYVEDITYTQAIGYLAGCLGGMARFDRNGELDIVWYDDYAYDITRNLQYLNGFRRYTNKQLTITSLSTGTKENPIVFGDGVNGTTINFENPYITADMAQDTFNMVNNFIYTPGQVKWRGDPAVQAGDIVHVYDKDNAPHIVLVMSQSIRIGGGCSSTIECKGTSETTTEFTNKFETVGQKINRFYSTLEQSIINATNAISGNSGGYVQMLDTNGDGKPDEIVILDTPNKETATKVWRWNQSGLAYANNPAGGAYNGPYRTAITAEGEIVADFITTGTLNASRIAVENFSAADPTKITDYIHFDSGSMTFGKGDSAITLKLVNDQVAFYRGTTRIAYFGANSFEIENLTDGQIRFQNLIFTPRASGNVSITMKT